MVRDYDATVEFVRASSNGDMSRMGISGCCRGGRTALVYAAANPRLKAAVAWYGAVGGQVNEYTPRTVMDRAGDAGDPERLDAEQWRAALEEPLWAAPA